MTCPYQLIHDLFQQRCGMDSTSFTTELVEMCPIVIVKDIFLYELLCICIIC